MTRLLPTTPSPQQISEFIADLAARYDRSSRNRKLDEQTGTEIIRPVSEWRKVVAELAQSADELCGWYLLLDPEGRERVRALVRGHEALLRGLSGHVGGAAMHVTSPEDVEWVRRGLAAASIADGQDDYRDLFVALGRLYLAAIRNRIDASRWFEEVGNMSSPTITNPRAFKWSMRDFLLGFEQTVYFRSSIANEVERIKRQSDGSSR